MRKRAAVLGILAIVSPVAAGAEGVSVDHRTVGCVVAGKYPRLNACFAPASRLARARVYFRVKNAPPDWYYVEMASDAPCHAGVLPRPKKDLVGRRIQYYVDALDRDFAESRTKEAEALVVANASDCESKLPVAPVLDGATVAVYPGLPAGFAGAGAGAGLGAGTTAALVGGAALVVGGGVALAAGGSDGASPSPTTTTLPPPTLPPTTTTTTTTLAIPGFNPVFKVFKGGALVEADPVVGIEPLELQFDMCETTGPYRIRYGILVDGSQQVDRCRSSITFTTTGVVAGPFASAVRRSASRSYAVQMTIRSEGPNNDPKANRRFTVQVSGSGSGGGCSADTQGPAVSLTKPSPGSLYPRPAPYPVHFEAFADDSSRGNNGIAFVEYKVNYPGPDQAVLGPVTAGTPWPYDWTESAVNAYLGTACAKFLQVQAYARDNCGNETYSPAVQVIVNNTGPCASVEADAAFAKASSSATLVSELAVPGGAGQVVANGEAVFPRAGRSPLAVRVRPGSNRVEATLVEARSGGTWRFEVGAMSGYRLETLRVVAGEVVQLDAESVTFRLRGRPGERVVFAFTAGAR